MRTIFHILWTTFIAILWQPSFAFLNSCQDTQNELLSQEECSDLYFEPSEKATNFGRIKLDLQENILKVTPLATTWTNTFLKITENSNKSYNFCSKLSKNAAPDFYCFMFKPEMENETFTVEYKIEKLPDISSRRILFKLPKWSETPLFLYIDQTDLSRLMLKAQKLPNLLNVSYYKLEAFKEKNGKTNLQDLRHFSTNDDINYELFTYNDAGNYYFIVWVMGNECKNGICLKIVTPKVFIARKSMRVVIGIVGASFILPFVLFIFHILTKKYPPDDSILKPDDRIVVAYKSSSKKHNEVVQTFAAFLESINNQVVDIVDLSKPRKFAEKFCIDSLFIASRVVYIAPPKTDSNPIIIDKSLLEKEMVVVIFSYCVTELPFSKNFKMFEELETFLQEISMSQNYDKILYQELVKKVEEASTEVNHSGGEILPKIIVTESESQENDCLIISSKD